MVTTHQGDNSHRNCPKKFKIVETYWHDHSLESFWGALSDGTISWLIHPFSGDKCIFWILFIHYQPWADKTFRKISQNKMYLSEISWRKFISDHLSNISSKLFQHVQNMLKFADGTSQNPG
jgi:hypothetical protein